MASDPARMRRRAAQTVRVTVRITEDARAVLDRVADERGESLSLTVEYLIVTHPDANSQ